MKCTQEKCPIKGLVGDVKLCTAHDCIYRTHPPMTNADRIRAMSDEELTREIFLRCDCPNCPLYGKCGGDNKACTERILHWLQQPAEVPK